MGEHSLADIQFLKELPRDALASVEARCRWRRYGSGQFVVTQDDDNRDLFMIVSGRVRVTLYSPSGKEVNFRELAERESFGELSAIDGQPRSASVITLTDCTIASMSPDLFWEILNKYPPVAAAALKRLAALVRLLSERVFEFSTMAVRNRIHVELLRLARNAGPVGGKAVICPVPTHAEIASRVSTHREAVTREFNDLSRAGIITRQSGRSIVVDVGRLTELAKESAP